MPKRKRKTDHEEADTQQINVKRSKKDQSSTLDKHNKDEEKEKQTKGRNSIGKGTKEKKKQKEVKKDDNSKQQITCKQPKILKNERKRDCVKVQKSKNTETVDSDPKDSEKSADRDSDDQQKKFVGAHVSIAGITSFVFNIYTCCKQI